MHIRGNVLILDADNTRRQALENLLSFLNIEWISDVHSDVLIHWSKKPELSGVLVGNIPNNPVESLIVRFPKIPFVTTGALKHTYPNHVGELKAPVVYDHLIQLLHRCQSFKRLPANFQQHQKSTQLLDMLVGQGDAMDSIRCLIEQVACKDANVLITGESGTGKELIAKAIHELSARSKHAFIPINCGAIPPDLLESELFGHEKGAFTGAVSSRKGRFELAQGGTLFLDEIGDMPLLMQVKLLRVLQERVIERVGGGQLIPVDVRIIAATHCDLEAMIEKKLFREDLYYRLNVFPIETPSLRTRIDDLPLLFHELMIRHMHQHGAHVHLTQRALASLMQQPWHGNIRELSNLVERLIILFPDQVVDVRDLPLKYQMCDGKAEAAEAIDTEHEALTQIFHTVAQINYSPEATQTSIDADTPILTLPSVGLDLKKQMVDIEMAYIKQALQLENGVVARAARILNMQRTTLVEKMKKYQINHD